MDLVGVAEEVWLWEMLAEKDPLGLREVIIGCLYAGGPSLAAPKGGGAMETEDEGLMSVRPERRRIDRREIIADVVVVVDWIFLRTKW